MKIRLSFLLFTFLVSINFNLAQGVQIDPPNWWAGMKETNLQLMVYAPNISSYKLNIQSHNIKLRGTTTLPNPNYLLIDLDLTNLSNTEKLKMVFFSDNDRQVVYYDFKERKQGSAKRYGVTQQDFMYLIMPDRFANGDTSNDVVEGMNETILDRNQMYKRHGGDLKGITNNLEYLDDLGVTALWINPVLENNQPEFSYHGYAITDHYKVDARLGTNEQYKEMVETCHRRQMKVVADMVFNHLGNEHWLYKDLPYEQWVHEYDSFPKSNYRAATVFDPHASKHDRDMFFKGWFDTHMPDLNFSTEYIRKYFIQNSIWWMEYANLDGIRIDTYAYPGQDFMNEWVKAIRKEYPRVLLFGETWVNQPGVQAYFQKNRFGFTEKGAWKNAQLSNVTDFQVYFAIKNALTKPSGWSNGLAEIYYVLTQDYMVEKPEKNVIFLDNHDLSRFYGIVEKDMRKFKIGVGLLMTLRGIPQWYYGSEILMSGLSNPDGLVREDFPGGWQEDQVNKFTEEGRSVEENEAFNYLKSLANYRKDSPVLQEGDLMQFTPEPDQYVYFRFMKKRGSVMVVVNTSEETKELKLDRYQERLDGFIGGIDVVTGKDSRFDENLKLEPMSIKILELVPVKIEEEKN